MASSGVSQRAFTAYAAHGNSARCRMHPHRPAKPLPSGGSPKVDRL